MVRVDRWLVHPSLTSKIRWRQGRTQVQQMYPDSDLERVITILVTADFVQIKRSVPSRKTFLPRIQCVKPELAHVAIEELIAAAEIVAAGLRET